MMTGSFLRKARRMHASICVEINWAISAAQNIVVSIVGNM